MNLNKINWSYNIGGAFLFDNEILSFLHDFKNYYNTDDTPIKSVYGSSFGLRFGSGRVLKPGCYHNLDEIKQLIQLYNEQDVGVNFTWSQHLITEEDLDDKLCNEILSYANNGMNKIIYTSPLLKQYIKENYNNYQFIYSACNVIDSAEDYNKAAEENDYVVLIPDFNKDEEFLKQIKHPEKFEVIINERCPMWCPCRMEHYENMDAANKASADHVLYDNTYEIAPLCVARLKGYENPIKTTCSFEDMDKLIDLGFTHFKLSGRELPWDLLIQDINLYIERYMFHRFTL